ncbi:MAG: hypothetical protein WEE36_04370 [Acidimicrobiia bacterium]
MRRLSIVAVIVLTVGACGDSGGVSTTSLESTTIGSTAATTTSPTVVSTTTTTTEAATTTEGSSLPSYSDVIATYPAGTDVCNTQAGIQEAPDGGYAFGGFLGEGPTISIRNGESLFWCLGGKYVVTGPLSDVDADGQPIPEGAYLTFNADMEFVQISSFD